ncbi:MAG TPA: magnesium transporter [Clostridiaceae bacterium]|nr:magnesium transporter [Clostridiaceae bacterium]
METMEIEKIEELIEEKEYVRANEALSTMNEADVTEILAACDPYKTLLLFRMLPKRLAAEVFSRFTPEQQLDIVSSVTSEELKDIVNELYFDDKVDLIEEMPANMVKKILSVTGEKERELINQFLNYPEDSAGSLMTIEYVDLKKHMTVRQALDRIKKTGMNKETIYTCYVTDAERRLEGIVSLRTLVTSDEDLVIGDIMEPDIVRVNTHDDQENVAHSFKKYGYLALPVIDNENRLTGIITVDDIIDIMEQEATEDFQRMAAMSPSEEAYLSTGVFAMAWQRLPWLLILMVSATFTGRIMGRYENILTQAVVLSAFIPMLMDTGGNSGSQTSTLVIRGLALGDITTRDWWKVIWKEMSVSFLVGVALAVTNFVRLLLLEKIETPIALTVSITIVVTVMAAKIVGGVLPLIAKLLKIDPAIMAGPLITTIVDALALMVYFVAATALLGL